jgi:succinoglycan biosynthesis transport protein ExoP
MPDMTEISPESTTPLPYRNAVPAERPASDIKSFEPPYTESGSDEALNLRNYWRVFVKRKWTILIPFIIIVVIMAISTLLMTPIYRATVILQIDREAPKVVKFETVSPVEMDDNDQQFYQTQYELLKSRTLAERVVDQLNLAQNATFRGDARPGFWAGVGRQAKAQEPLSVPVSIKSRLIESFLTHLTVEPVRNSKLVKLHYDLPDPRLAARVANALAQSFIHLNLERRFEAASYAKNFLEQRLAQVRARLEDSEQKLGDFTRTQGIINVDERQTTLTIQKFQTLSSSLAEAEKERISVESLYREALAAQGHGLTRILDSQAINMLKLTQANLVV